jgi:glycosyltransferase involved in cell wall biosynthesis
LRIVLLLWDGDLGGAETVTGALAAEMRRSGQDARILFIRQPGRLGALLDQLRVPFDVLGVRRSSLVLWRPRAFADVVRRTGADAAILPAPGHLAMALRLGGYGAPILAAEHGSLLVIERAAQPWRLLRLLERAAGVRCVDVEIPPSQFMRNVVLRHRHARLVTRIYNGVDLHRFKRPGDPALVRDGFVVAAAARLIEGKGIAELLQAFAPLVGEFPRVTLRIAGDGPERSSLEGLASNLCAPGTVEFAGSVDDMPAFWGACELAVAPSATVVESFGLTALEAMAAGRPVVATTNGGLGEVVEDGRTGSLVPPADVNALQAAIRRYVSDPELCARHGDAGRRRAEAVFDISRSARAYVELIHSLAADRAEAISV